VGRKLLLDWEKQTPPGLTEKTPIWLGKRITPKMGETNFPIAGNTDSSCSVGVSERGGSIEKGKHC
jgi:hypothetical protein